MRSALFREAAVQARSVTQSGQGSRVPPPAHWLAAGVALSLAVLIVAFLLFASYTASEQVRGYLTTESGGVRVFAARRGVVAETRVTNGTRVSRGAPLLRVTAEHAQTATSAAEQIVATLQAELADVDGRLERTGTRQQTERDALEAGLAALTQRLKSLEEQLRLQESRLRLDAERLQRMTRLAEQGHVASAELRSGEAAHVVLQQQRAELAAKLDEQRALIAQRQIASRDLPLRQRDELAALRATRFRLARELAEVRGRAAFWVNAPASGRVSGLAVRRGERVDGSRPLLTILPERLRFQALLLVPSRAIGFLQVGDTVRVRVDAYPHQKFGDIAGTIVSVSRTAVLPGELLPYVPLQEASYRVPVALAAQSIVAGNRKLPLTAGMAVTAEVRRDRRRLIEWLLAPLMSLGRRT